VHEEPGPGLPRRHADASAGADAYLLDLPAHRLGVLVSAVEESVDALKEALPLRASAGFEG